MEEPLQVGEVGEIIDLDEIVGQTLIEEELPLEVPVECPTWLAVVLFDPSTFQFASWL